MAFGKYQIRIRHVLGSWGPWIDVFDEEYQFTDLLPGTEYCVQTRAFCDTDSESGLSNEYCFITPDEPEPVIINRVFMGRWFGPTSNFPFTNETGPLSTGGERFIWQEGDIKVTIVATTGATANVTTPSGYAHAPGSPFSNTAGDRKINVLWKRITVEEPLSTLDVADPTAWTMFYNVRGAIETGDPWVDTATAEGSSNTLTFPTVACEEGGMVIFAAAMDPEITPTNSSYAYNWQNPNLREITNIDGSDITQIGHVGTIAISTITGESGPTTCELREVMDHALWCGSIKPSATQRPRVVGINNPSTGNVTGFGRDLPFYPSIQADESNYIFAFIETSDALVLDSTWTEAPDSPVINSGGTNPTRLSVWYKKVTTDMDVDVAFNRMGSAFSTGCGIIRGAISTGNPFESISTTTGSGTAITIPGGTTTVDNCLIVQAVGRNVSTNNSASYSAWANADLSSVTERVDRGTSTGDDAGIGIVSGVKASAGSYGSTTATLLNSTEWCTWQAAIKPAGLTAPTWETNNQAEGSGYPNSGLFATTTILPGDLLVTFCASDLEAPDRLVYGEEYGWTFVPTTVSTTGVGLAVAYKRASGIHPFIRWTSLNDHRTVTFAIFNGLDPDNPLGETENNTGVGTTASVPGGTTTEDDTLVIHAVSSGISFTPGLQTSVDWTNADLVSVNRGVEVRSFTGNGGYVDSAYGYKATAGAFGATTVTLGLSDAWSMWRGVLKRKP